MSDHEFDNYLALLARLLRLDAKQRESIAGELRTHFEDRLDDLIARGVPRHEAVRQALEEFGDAAALAAEFAFISRNKRRRWLMRVTTFSVAATVLIAAGIATFWPGRNAGPGVAAVVAQDPFGAPKAAVEKKPDGNQDSKLAVALNQRLDVSFIESPLKDVIGFLKNNTGVSFHFRLKALVDAGVNADSPITVEFKQIRLSTLLDLVLDDLDLTYVEKDDLILITSHEDAESTMEVRVYDCRDLLAMPAPPGADKFVPAAASSGVRTGGMFAVEDVVPKPGGDPAAGGAILGQGVSGGGTAASSDGALPLTEHDLRARRLMKIITTNVDNQTWEDVGGPGSISEYNGLIVVTQTTGTHKKIERVLDMLREAAGIDGPKAAKTKVVR